MALIVALVVAGLGAVALRYLSESREERPPIGGHNDVDERRLGGERDRSPFADVLAATEDGGDAQIVSTLDVRMPRSLDDGVPERHIDGSGVVAADLSSARLDYAMSKVPNSAGFFGHVDGDLAVAYSETEMLISFPLLDENVLADRGSWISFDLPFLSSGYLLELGVGQLRELALSDPRLGIALLNGVEDAVEASEAVDGGGNASPDIAGGGTFTHYEVEAGTLEAGAAVPGLDPLFTHMAEALEIRRVPMIVSVDDEDRIGRLAYQIVFPAGKRPGSVRLDVRLELRRFGLEAPDLPPDNEVVTHDDYFPGL